MTFSGKENEQILLKLIKDGDQAAMKALYDLHVKYLTAICSRYIADDEDVKDVLQDCFIKIFGSVDTFKYYGEGSLRGWMARITVNETLKFVKASGRLCTTPLREDDDSEDECCDADDEPPLGNIPPKIVHDMIRRLPEGYRTIFNLYVFEGKSHREIAAMLGIKVSSSASQLFRAKALLAKRIRQYMETNT